MLEIIHHTEDLDEKLEDINVDNDIIICSLENETVIRQNIDGTFSLVLNHDENLSSCKSAHNGKMAIVEYYPTLKISIPQGYKIQIDDPSFGFCFFDKIYPDCEILFPDEDNKINEDINAADLPFTDLPNRFIFHKFKFTFYIDLQRMADINKTMFLKKGQTVANIFFTMLPHYNQEISPKLYLIKNNEVYNQFTTLF